MSEGVNGGEVCFDCPAGYYCDKGVAAPLPCKKGTYSAATRAASPADKLVALVWGRDLQADASGGVEQSGWWRALRQRATEVQRRTRGHARQAAGGDEAQAAQGGGEAQAALAVTAGVLESVALSWPLPSPSARRS